MTQPVAHYLKPGPVTRRLMNPVLRAAMALGISVWGGRVLEVRGRKTGAVHRVPVNLLDLDGQQYLVAPRGDTQWARNVRAAEGRLWLLLGHRREERTATELTDADKVPVLRAYLRKWKMETGMFFDGVRPGSSDDEFRRIAPRHPVFVLGPKQD